MVIDALDQSVEDAKTRVASMHVTLKSCLNASVPKALAGINLSPSEFDSSIFSETQVQTYLRLCLFVLLTFVDVLTTYSLFRTLAA